MRRNFTIQYPENRYSGPIYRLKVRAHFFSFAQMKEFIAERKPQKSAHNLKAEVETELHPK